MGRGANRGAGTATDRGAHQRVKARDRAQKRAAAGAHRAVAQDAVFTPCGAGAERQAGDQTHSDSCRFAHDTLQFDWLRCNPGVRKLVPQVSPVYRGKKKPFTARSGERL